ncbi:hypothetical protein ACOSQ2_007259 [Xanthoceras sorbifolium]|uniref:Kinesin motor domain-containing protein n=1 Tax=Xanthoceras sorbifolium TaxID=99658 RepID=A0ABQ8I9S5_9ROSI|nr:hypothetical protein JRO89_XS03G0129000 [Xanthoceras sorbifolium]
MKHFMQPRNPVLRETHLNDSPSSSSSSKSKPLFRKQKSSKENAPPSDLNSLPPSSPAPPSKMKSPLPPRPPNSLKRKLVTDILPDNPASAISDSGVKVIVRMRPLNNEDEEGEVIVQKVTGDSVSINSQTFTFDSVADTDSTQLDVFQLIGVPLVENCLAGFNSSVFAYGQTGSGKTYTMWGPANALLEENLSGDQQGLTPRVLQRLFSRINEEQVKHAEKQLKYQCRCSFLEIYNEQITDLLDPSQRNLQIREDVKSGVYVENLREEYVCTMKDVTQLLIKGLSNRRTGATSINAESSRSHSVFTCIVESRCKSKSDGISRFKTSRINLVDLAGSERQKLTGAAGERLKEAGNINRSLSQLGNLINILAEVSQTGKQRHIPYRDSRLTFLLQDSLGGNAKLAMICAISPSQSCKSETFSTLRFAQRAKAIKNKAVVNEVMQDDVNHLREVIRQLRDELHRMKTNGNSQADSTRDYSASWARRSLNILKHSFHHPMTLPRIDDDGDEEMEIDEEAVEKLCDQVDLQLAGSEDCSKIKVGKVETSKSHSQLVASEDVSSGKPKDCLSESGAIEEQGSEDTDVNMEEEISEQVEDCKNEIMIADCAEPVTNTADVSDDTEQNHKLVDQNGENLNLLIVDEELLSKGSVNCVPPSGLSIDASDVIPVLKSPTPSVSPRVSNSRKSLRTSSMLTASQKDLEDDSKLGPEAVHMSFGKSMRSSLSETLSTQTKKNFRATTEHLAASLHRGLEIIDSHRQSSALRRSLFRFSYRPEDIKAVLPIHKVDVGVQTSQCDEIPVEDPMLFICSSCKNKTELDVNSSDLQLVPVDDSESADQCKKQVPKAVEKVLAGAIRREMAVEEFCAKQASEIKHLNRLVQQYKHERECNAIISQTREDKILRLESLMDGVLPPEEFMGEELASLMYEHKLLKEKYENHPEVLRTKIELKRVQDQLEHYRNFCDLGEREVLLEEIQDLRSQLQYYIDSSSSYARKRNSLLQLTYSCEPSKAVSLSVIPESTKESAEEKLEQERTHWTEVESKWISLAEELRTELEASKSLAEKQKQELDAEKNCSEELKEAMQMAMEGHARMLEQYADLEEKHIQLLARHRKIQEGIDDVKKAAAKAGVRGAESKFINSLAAEISALKVEREKERRYLRDENKGLQAQLRDTAEAVQAAGELLVRLKEAEEAVAAAQKRAMEAEEETAKAYEQIDQLKKKRDPSTLKKTHAVSCLPKEALRPAYDDSNMPKYDVGEPHGAGDEQWRAEFEQFYTEDTELSRLAEPSSWFSGYDRCNI